MLQINDSQLECKRVHREGRQKKLSKVLSRFYKLTNIYEYFRMCNFKNSEINFKKCFAFYIKLHSM